MQYRPARVGGEFAPWLSSTKGKSGVYIIRSALTHAVLYVGESHSGKLYKTITRHFWTWHKGYQVGGVFPVEIGVKLTKRSDAVDEQNRLIVRLRPRHNVNVPSDEVPF